MSSNLPHTVEVWLQDVYNQLKSDGFFDENDLAQLSENEGVEIFREIIGGAALNVWMDSGDVNLSPDDLTRLIFELMLRAHVEVLKKEGFIDSMFDDEGNEHLWMTEKGKKRMEELQEEFHSLLVDSGMEDDLTDDVGDDDPFFDEDES